MDEPRRATLRATLEQPAAPDDALRFVASSETLNRYGFRLRNEGWRLDNFNANPVILWMHLDFLPPIGRGRSVKESGKVVTAVTFDRSDPFAASIEQKYRSGFMNAVSVGFNFVDKAGVPLLNWWSLTPEQIYRDAFYDMSELSAVPVPADPQALKLARASLAWLGDELIELAGGMPEGWQRQGGMLAPPAAPTLPGNSDTDRRLAAVEEEVRALRGILQIQPHTTLVDDGEWDLEAANEVLRTVHDRESLRYCFAWADLGATPDQPDRYAFLHHAGPGAPANLHACRDGLERLAEFGIPEADRSAVGAHLRGHLDTPAETDLGWSPDVAEGFLAAIRL